MTWLLNKRKNGKIVAWILHSDDLNRDACVYMHVIAISYWLYVECVYFIFDSDLLLLLLFIYFFFSCTRLESTTDSYNTNFLMIRLEELTNCNKRNKIEKKKYRIEMREVERIYYTYGELSSVTGNGNESSSWAHSEMEFFFLYFS